MAETVLTLTYPDGQGPRLLNSFCSSRGWSEGEETQLEFFKRDLKNYVVKHVKHHERYLASREVAVDSELPITES